MRVVLFTVIVFVLSGSALFAEYKVDEGRRISKVCAGCHGTDGASSGQLIPILGGQKAAYIASSLQGFKDKSRAGEMMQKLSKAYSEKEMMIIGKWFESKPWVSVASPMDAMKIAGGKKLSESCEDCHGMMGKGMDDNPVISGQSASYLLTSLLEYKDGSRGETDMDGMLDDFTKADLELLAAYYSGLR